MRYFAKILLLSTSLMGAACSEPGVDEASEREVVDMNQDVDPEIQERLRGASQILALLEEAGEDLADERPIILYFFGEQTDLDRLKLDEVLAGFSLRDGAEQPMLIAEAEAVTDEEWVVRTTHDMVMVARKYGVEYDGWEAGVVKQGGD